MKYIQLKVEDELHKEIKLKAIDAGKSMHQYILECVRAMGSTFISADGVFKVKQPTKETKSGNGGVSAGLGDFINLTRSVTSVKAPGQQTYSQVHSDDTRHVAVKLDKPKEEYGGVSIEDNSVCQKCLYPLKMINHTCGKRN